MLFFDDLVFSAQEPPVGQLPQRLDEIAKDHDSTQVTIEARSGRGRSGGAAVSVPR